VAAQEHSPGYVTGKRGWKLSEQAFQGFLHWLDEGVDSQGHKYLEIRRRLTVYFDRHNCAHPDDLADETLNRVARRIEETGAFDDTPPARYCYITAKYVLLERFRESSRIPLSLDALPSVAREAALSSGGVSLVSGADSDERRLHCLESCLGNLEPQDRELICEYYQGERRWKIENRRQLAMRCGASLNALAIRACRIRGVLENCVRRCMSAAATEEEWRA
jgi:hypothetical protein